MCLVTVVREAHFEDFFSSHPGGVSFVFADGHVAFLSDWQCQTRSFRIPVLSFREVR